MQARETPDSNHTVRPPWHLLIWLATAAWSGCSAPPAPPAPDEGPTADAGPDKTVSFGDAIILDASASSDPRERVLSFTWFASPDNPNPVVLSQTMKVRIVPRLSGDYIFYLAVTAGDITSQADSVLISVIGSDTNPPVANAGMDAIYRLDALAFLDGSGQDADGDSLAFSWQLVSGPDSVAIANPNSAQTGITAFVDGHYTFHLAVSDCTYTAIDEVTIVFTPKENLPPVSDAGLDQTVSLGSLVKLNGSRSADSDSVGTLSFHWSVGRTPGEAIELADSTTATPSFFPNQLGEYIFGLTVDDGMSAGIQDLVTILVIEQTFSQRGGMIEVPGGRFLMGTDNKAALDDQRPAHTVHVSAFWIDSVEVTTSQYHLCVDDGTCGDAGQRPGCNAGRNDRGNHPINCVTWNQAEDFCSWARKRLPTEAEWEKAARGDDGRLFPWGNDDPHTRLLEDPELQLLNFNDNLGTTDTVGTYPAGRSYYGLHNMAGNVMEWTADHFARDYYDESPENDPVGPGEGSLRVARGGFFGVGFSEALTTTVRNANPPTESVPGLGFRCARTNPP